MTTPDKLTDDLVKELAAGGMAFQSDAVAMARELLAHRRASQAAPANWQDDPAADDRWCAGNDFALSRLCAVLKVDPDLVDWDGSDNSLQDEADALILRILNAQAAPAPSDGLREENERLRMALREIGASIDCGCSPCTNRCRTGEAAEIELEARQEIARAALSASPAQEGQKE